MSAEASQRFGPRPALRQLAAFTPRQAGLSVALSVLVALACVVGKAYALLALFACLLLAALVMQGGIAVLRLLLPEGAGWRWCWLAQPFLLACAAGAAAQAYPPLNDVLGGASLSSPQMWGSALAFAALVGTVPLMYAQRQAGALRLSELQRAALSAELKSLQAQVEPHFLYNTLANTRYLARHDPERAVSMLDHLIAYLRAALPDMRTPSSTLGRECELAGHYLALMEIRFGARLSTHVECPPALQDLAVPPMMLMSLVENAVQHGVEPKPGAVRVSVAAAERAGRLSIVVRDDGAGLQAALGSGVGLRNVRERLHALFGERAAFELRTAADGATEAQLLLPLERA